MNSFLGVAFSILLAAFLLVSCKSSDVSTVTPTTPVPSTTVITGTTTNCTAVTGLARVVCLAEAFNATLNTTQLAAAQLAYTKTDAVKWSNFPQAATNPRRVGINLGSLNATQMAAFRALMSAVLVTNVANEGFDELQGLIVADSLLAVATGNTSTFGSGNYYIAFLGTPSTTGLWELQYGGHHYAFADTYNGGQVTGVTPSFRGVELMTPYTQNGKTYQPMEQERSAFATLFSGLSSSEQTTAKLSTSFSDVLLGPGRDNQFPATRQGVRVGDLSTDKQAFVLNAVRLYANDLDSETAAAVVAKYQSGMADTYVAYSGTGTMNTVGDYVRIDGPAVWIEYSAQTSRDIPGPPHVHSVWRDRTSDYGGSTLR